MKFRAIVLTVFALVSVPCFGQEITARNDPPKVEGSPADSADKKEEKKDDNTGIVLPNNERMRIRLRFMSQYGFDGSQAAMGFEKQGRVGYVIGEVFGKLSNHVSYRFEVNAVSDNQPGVSCGEKNFFFPNSPQSIGPNVTCTNDGRMAVDDYKFRGLDPMVQQQHIRQAYLVYAMGPVGVKFGRFIHPIGFDWEVAGSFTAKDAPHIQRINAEASFGFQVSFEKKVGDRQFASLSFSGVTGDGNKFHDYDYFYGLDGSLDSNSWPTGILSGILRPTKNLEFRAAWKKGDTGSKVERLPNFYASKRNDDAVVLSLQYTPFPGLRVFGEKANYTWGLMKTSAELLGLDQAPVKKDGYYVGAELSHSIGKGLRVGTVLTREELSRDDALVKYMSELGMYRAMLGKKERSTGIRFYVDLPQGLRVGAYRNLLSNPFPWLSGIQPVDGESSFRGRDSDKWGLVVRLTVQ